MFERFGKPKVLGGIAALLVAAAAFSATVVDDNLTGQICSDGLIYVGGCPGGGDPVQVTGYFVDSADGSNSNSGLTSALAWETISKVNTELDTSDISADVWLKTASTFNNQPMTVDFSGTSSNESIIGCYYVSSGNPVQCENF